MWKVEFARDENGRPLGKTSIEACRKKYPNAVGLLQKRLDAILHRLNIGSPEKDALSFGWVHPEKGRIFGIDPLPNNPPLRMYCALVPKTETVLIFTIGGKSRQQKELDEIFEWAGRLLK